MKKCGKSSSYCYNRAATDFKSPILLQTFENVLENMSTFLTIRAYKQRVFLLRRLMNDKIYTCMFTLCTIANPELASRENMGAKLLYQGHLSPWGGFWIYPGIFPTLIACSPRRPLGSCPDLILLSGNTD